MKILLMLVAVLCLSLSHAQERKALASVDMAKMLRDMQAMRGTQNSLDMVIWYSAEWWEASLARDPYVSRAQVDEFMASLGTYAIVGVVQADVAAPQGFTFFERERVTDALKIEYINERGESREIPHDIDISETMRELLDVVQPMMASGMGEMGRHFHFMPIPDRDNEGMRIVSPYEKGVVKFHLAAHEGEAAPVLSLEFPSDALFVPRICPNGKPAHVSWNYCPWSGKELD